MRTLRSAAMAAFALAAYAGLALQAEAQSRRAPGPGYGWVTAESRYGPQTITAPVRQGPHGLQVRLPGGTWVDCGRSCRETLRRETVDFWAIRDGCSGDTDGPGYLRFRF
jgi:hypothetical protein